MRLNNPHSPPALKTSGLAVNRQAGGGKETGEVDGGKVTLVVWLVLECSMPETTVL